MALFKCKMCGGDLEIAEGVTIAECEYCGTKQTVPTVRDENMQVLFNRANTLRIKSEFDKAEKLYEKIIQADPTQTEAYWGLILCKYGIEYVDDPATFKKVPTCHRASYDSIVADDDYKSALKYADLSQRAIFEEQAREIDRIQKDILALAQKEETYDVFICYKETDANGQRTQDSVIANDIYYQLTQEGFKVFYAAITLEDKLGSAYEPIIFAALNSSKVMLSIGTKPEYFSAVWVKNEWSRFLKMMKNDRSKMLIPCYKGMDAYELPEEFAHLQAQDMGKIGFINDIVRGIKKVIVKDEPKTTVVKETVVTSSGSSVDPLLKRAFMFLEDEEWDSAKEYAEKILDIDPENAKAYLVKFLAEYDLKNCSFIVDAFSTPFFEVESADFQKAMRFGDEALREELNGYIKAINDRNEHDRLQGIYDDAKAKMRFNTHASCLEASKLFESINAYLDSSKLVTECREKAEVCRKNDIYYSAMSAVRDGTVASFLKAIDLFKSIPDWEDSNEQVAKCEEKLPELREKEEKERIEREQKAEQERIEAAKRAKRNKRIAIIASSICGLVATFLIILTIVIIPRIKYDEAIALSNSGNIYDAYNVLQDVKKYGDEYEDFSDHLASQILAEAESEYFAGNASKAAEILSTCDINDSLRQAYQYVADGKYRAATSWLSHIVIPDGITVISEEEFYGCSSLVSITIPPSIKDFEFYAFEGCRNLESVYISDLASWLNIDSGFYDNPLQYAKNLYLNGELITDVVIPSNVTEIRPYALSCDSLRSIYIDGDVEIYNSAFANCANLKDVNISNGVVIISEGAFEGCGSIENISIPFTGEKYNAGDEYKSHLGFIFGYEVNGAQSEANGHYSKFEEYNTGWKYTCYTYNIPNSLQNVKITGTSVAAYAFQNTDIATVTLAKSVAKIGINAFSGCDNLTKIIYEGTVEEFENISFEESWNDKLIITEIVCSNGVVKLK